MDQRHLKIEKDKARQLRKSLWWQNLIANAPKCYYCQTAMSKDEVTMDHIVPISRGGRSTKGNLAPCCKACNSRKKYLTPVEWQEYLTRLS